MRRIKKIKVFLQKGGIVKSINVYLALVSLILADKRDMTIIHIIISNYNQQSCNRNQINYQNNIYNNNQNRYSPTNYQRNDSYKDSDYKANDNNNDYRNINNRRSRDNDVNNNNIN